MSRGWLSCSARRAMFGRCFPTHEKVRSKKQKIKSRTTANGLENFPALQMAAAVPSNTDFEPYYSVGRHAPQISLDFFGTFCIKAKSTSKKLGNNVYSTLNYLVDN